MCTVRQAMFFTSRLSAFIGNEVAGALLESSVLFANTDDWEKSRGPTYGVGTTAFVSSAINAITAFVSYQLAGDGPIFRFIGSAPAERAGAAHG